MRHYFQFYIPVYQHCTFYTFLDKKLTIIIIIIIIIIIFAVVVVADVVVSITCF